MDIQALREAWLAEQAQARIHGWDFSHLDGRCSEEDDLPWDYRAIVCAYLKPSSRLLDLETGGGEFLLSLEHPFGNTAAMEGYVPNVELCREKLMPLGIDFRPGNGNKLPFEDAQFDLVINRHGDFDAEEIRRVLKPGGLFITQQVGEDNDRELVELLLPGTPKPFPGMNLRRQRQAFLDAGFDVIRGEECFRLIRFFDTGALVWFARVIEWEFPGFSVETCLPGLLRAQRMLEENGAIEGTIHRYLIVAQKRPDAAQSK